MYIDKMLLFNREPRKKKFVVDTIITIIIYYNLSYCSSYCLISIVVCLRIVWYQNININTDEV